MAPAFRRVELALQVERLLRELAFARKRVEVERRLMATGRATQLQLKRAEVELLETELQLQRTRQELYRIKPHR